MLYENQHHNLPYGCSASTCKHARCNIHACKLLEEQFCRVRNVDLRDLGLVLTAPAIELLRLEFSMW
jgi:hypothetical protein